MKIKISLVSLLLAFAMSSFAQEAKTVSDVAGVNTSFDAMKQHTWDNWFIQLGVGGQWLAAENFKFSNMMDGTSIAPTLAIGRWWTPYWGFRLKGELGGLVNDLKSFPTGNTDITQKFTYSTVQLDAMWNMSQYFGKYNAKRVFNFIPYAGLGAYFRGDVTGDNVPANLRPTANHSFASTKYFTVNGGLLFEFRLNDLLGIHVDLAGAVGDDFLNGWQGGKRYDLVGTASVGVTFNLGKSYFDVVQPMDQGLINDLNNKINDLRNENDLLSRRPVSCPACPECPSVQQVQPATNAQAVTTSDWKNVVLFRIGSAVIDANQRINIYNTAQFVKNSGEKVKVVGYADKQTGSAAYNLRLSEKRAKAVAQELTSRFGIASNNIVVEWKGAAEQPFKENAWNRVVIMSAK